MALNIGLGERGYKTQIGDFGSERGNLWTSICIWKNMTTLVLASRVSHILYMPDMHYTDDMTWMLLPFECKGNSYFINPIQE